MQDIINSNQKINLYTIVLFILLSILPLFDAGFNNNIPIYMLLLALVVLIFKNNIYKIQTTINTANPLFLYILYILWCGFSFIWSIYYIRTMMELFELILYGCIFYITIQLNDEDNSKVISVVLLIGSGIALLGILEYIIVTNSRIVSTFTNPNPFGTYLLVLFLFSWGLGLRLKKKDIYLSSLLFLVAILLSGSRGAYFSTILAFPLLYIGLNKKEIRKNILKSVVLLIIALIITRISMYIAPIVQDKIGLSQSMLDALIRKDTLIGSSLVGRLEFWKVAWELIKNKPIQGYGLGTFFSAYYIEYGGNQWYSRFVHNHYLQIMAETGFVGISLYLLFLFSSIGIIWRRLKTRDYPIYMAGAVASVVGFLLHIGAEFSFNFPGVTVIFFWILAMTIRGHEFAHRLLLSFKLNYKIRNIILGTLVILVLYNITFFKLSNLATRYALDGNQERALDLVQFSNKYYPISPFGLELEGSYFYNDYKQTKSRDDLGKAINAYEKALTLATYDGGIHNKLGNFYSEFKDLDKAEEHLILAAEYGAYNISRYMDLGLFYLNQGRKIDAEKVFIEGASLKEYAIKSASATEKDSMVINAIALHAMLYNIYKDSGQEVALQAQIHELNSMMENYPFLKEYFSIEMFVN